MKKCYDLCMDFNRNDVGLWNTLPGQQSEIHNPFYPTSSAVHVLYSMYMYCT